MEDLTSQKLNPLINGLNRALGRAENTSSEIVQEFGRSYGNVFTLHGLWLELGINKVLNRALCSSRRDFDAEALIRVMVFYRLCVPDRKLDCLRWLETVVMPAIPESITHQQLLQAMDALLEHLDVVEDSFARQFPPLVDHALSARLCTKKRSRSSPKNSVCGDLHQSLLNGQNVPSEVTNILSSLSVELQLYPNFVI